MALRRMRPSRGRYWFRLAPRSTKYMSNGRFIIVPAGTSGWLAILAFAAAAVAIPFVFPIHGSVGWLCTGGEMSLLLGFACLVLATCDPREPDRDG